MNPKPQIIQITSPNYGLPRGTSGRNGRKVIAIVDHIMSGTLAGTDSWFQNPASQASAHFGVGKNGDIRQYVDINNVAWANGGVNKPSWPLLITGVNPNYYTVSIEHEGQSGDVMPEAQYQATLALHRWLCDVFGIAPGPDTVIGHYRIDSVSRAGCPGSGFPWARLFSDLKGDVDVPNHVIAFWSAKDYSGAIQISERLGNCLMTCRNAKPDLHPDAKAAKHLIVVGGPKVTDHPNVTNLCGDTGPDTAILAAKYAQTL